MSLGIQGPQGFLGPTGASGIAGVQGKQGPLGPGGAQGATGPIGPTGVAGLANYSSAAVLSTISIMPYTQSSITNSVSLSTNTLSYIASMTLPPAIKSKSGLLSCYFNVSTTSSFMAGAYFDYGLYLDGVALGMGDSQFAHYSQISTYSVAMSWNGLTLGSNATTPYRPITIPVSIGANSCNLQIGIKNSSLVLGGSAIIPSPTVSTTITTSGSNFYTVPTGASGVYMYLWGCGGNNAHCAGGGGGYVSGFYSCAAGTNLLYALGAPHTYGGGPTNGYDATAGGGYTGVFLSNAGGLAQSNAIAIAGGGGSGGYFGNGNGGGGGYPTGSPGRNQGTLALITGQTGGTQTAGGTGGAAGGALTAAQSGLPSGAQSGGGGWYGGSSGKQDRFPGCGGSSYVGNLLGGNPSPAGIGLTSGAYTEDGITSYDTTYKPYGDSNTAGITSPYYVYNTSYGIVGNATLVLVPAVSVIKATIGMAASIVC